MVEKTCDAVALIFIPGPQNPYKSRRELENDIFMQHGCYADDASEIINHEAQVIQ